MENDELKNVIDKRYVEVQSLKEKVCLCCAHVYVMNESVPNCMCIEILQYLMVVLSHLRDA